MPCYHPIEVMIPSRIKTVKVMFPQVVPCGNCVGCRAEQGRQWAVRMMHEARMHKSSLFITLTYNEQEIPENGALCPQDFQRFIKDLRRTRTESISFFGCGEYGEKTQRPHYHAIVFGVDFLDKFSSFDPARPRAWGSKTLGDIWGRGNTEIGTVTMASASYVAGYIRKKVKLKDYVRCNPHTGEILLPEFARMSLRPAIGRRWISKFWRDVYPRDFIVIDGVEAKPPRYYDKWMDQDHPKEVHDCREHRELMISVRETRYLEAKDLTPYQLAAGEKIQESRINLFQGRDRL